MTSKGRSSFWRSFSDIQVDCDPDFRLFFHLSYVSSHQLKTTTIAMTVSFWLVCRSLVALSTFLCVRRAAILLCCQKVVLPTTSMLIDRFSSFLTDWLVVSKIFRMSHLVETRTWVADDFILRRLSFFPRYRMFYQYSWCDETVKVNQTKISNCETIFPISYSMHQWI